MLMGRSLHGCTSTTIKKQLHLVVFGGSSNYVYVSSIHLYNFDTQKWSAAPAPMALKSAVSVIKGTKIIKMDDEGCDLMFIDQHSLFICSGTYQWTEFPSANIDGLKNVVTVGANDLLPCGI